MAQEQMSMSDILSDAPPPKEEEKVETAEAPPPEKAEAEVERAKSVRKAHQRKEWEAQGRDPETGQFVTKEKVDEPKAEVKKEPEAKAPEKTDPPKEEMTAKEKAAFAAAADERRKRQALEAELAKYRQQPAAQPAAQPGEKPKTFWDDPEGALKAHQEQVRTETINTRLQLSEMLARRTHEDFDEKIAKFSELVQATPGLAQQWLSSPDPAEFAYKAGKAHLELDAAGSLDKLREKMEKELRAQIDKEYREKAEKERAERAAIPPSLSTVRGAAPQHKEVWNGPTPFADILKG